MAITKQLRANLSEIISNFNISGSIASCTPFGSGHINDSIRLKNNDPSQPGYLLQRINHQVFKNVPALMQNILLVTRHLKTKVSAIPGTDPDKEVMTLVTTINGELFYQDADGNYWRIYHFLKDTKSYDLVTTSQQAYEGGKAFGKFQHLLADMDASMLDETITGFHNMQMRLDQLKQAIDGNIAGRVSAVDQELDFISQRANVMCTILRLAEAGELPLRITHNDTKYNNVLLNANDQAQCVIDLDTVMPGYVAYDFGDAIRTIINTAEEDEENLAKINLNIPLFEAYTKGYLEEAGGFLTAIEIKSLMLGVMMLPFIQAVRFLTDYLNGDTYFKVSHAGHNLQRAKAQMQLIRKLEEQQGTLQAIVDKLAKKQ